MRYCIRIFIWMLLYTGCKEHVRNLENKTEDVNNKLTEMNAKIVGNESKKIDSFIAGHSYQMNSTGTGLRYEIYFHGNGKKPYIHDEVTVNYQLYLLDGTKCYSSDSDSCKFRIGIGQQARGLEEGLMMMVPGDKARLVVPAHLGYGISGDQNKIPPASTLFYDVELITVIK